MLNKKEIAVMKCIFGLCENNNGSCIVSDARIIESCAKHRLDENAVDVILKQLEYDGYFENVKSDKNGKIVNVVTLKQKGKAFKREVVQRRRELLNTAVWRMVFAGLGAVVALMVNSVFR